MAFSMDLTVSLREMMLNWPKIWEPPYKGTCTWV
jgi:hypothetical protein